MKRQVLMMLGCGLLLGVPTSSWAREWTDKTGKYSIEADLVEVSDKKVTLRKSDGSLLTLRVARLSEKDQRFLKALERSAPKRSTLDAAVKNAVSGLKVVGKIHGYDFTPDKVELEGGTLTFRQGKDFFPDLAVEISLLFTDGGKNPEGKTYRVTGKERFGEQSPHVEMGWREDGKGIPKTQSYFDGYKMTLQFGKVSEGKLPGKIKLRFPDKTQSSIAGTFVIDGLPGAPGTGLISGSITVPSQSKGLNIWVTCLGKNSEGKLECPGVSIELDTSASATCSTWKPRTSSLSWDQGSWHLTHKHINRPPGWYLVSVRGTRNGLLSREGYYDWKWVEIKEDETEVTVDLTVDPSNLGTLEVRLSGPTKESSVTYLPLDEGGQLPYPKAFHYLSSGSSAKIEGGKAVIRGLREGKYQVAMGPWQPGTRLPSTKTEVLVKRGSTTKVELTPPPAVPPKRTRTRRKKEVPTERKKEDPTGLPDLEVTKVYLNEGGYMRAQVKNRGAASATEHMVAFFIDGKRRANCRCMAIQSGAEFEASAMRLPAGTHVVKVVADADDTILESDETNNSREAILP